MTRDTRDCQSSIGDEISYESKSTQGHDYIHIYHELCYGCQTKESNIAQLFCGFSIPIPRAHTHTNTLSVASRVLYKPRTASQGEGLVVAWWPQRVCQRNSLHFSPVSASNSHFPQHEVSTSQCSQRLERQTLALNGRGPGNVGVRGCRAERLTPSMLRLKGCTYS